MVVVVDTSVELVDVLASVVLDDGTVDVDDVTARAAPANDADVTDNATTSTNNRRR